MTPSNKFQLSLNFLDYIKIKYPDMGDYKITNLEELVYFCNDNGRFFILRDVCSDIGWENDYGDRVALIKECVDLSLDLNVQNGFASPAIFKAIETRPDLAWAMFENGVYNDDLKKYCKEKDGYYSLPLSVVKSLADASFNESKIKILNYLVEQKEFNPVSFVYGFSGLNLLQEVCCPVVAQWLLDQGCSPLQCNSPFNINPLNAIKHHEKQENHIIVAVLKNHIAQKECGLIKGDLKKKRKLSSTKNKKFL